MNVTISAAPTPSSSSLVVASQPIGAPVNGRPTSVYMVLNQQNRRTLVIHARSLGHAVEAAQILYFKDTPWNKMGPLATRRFFWLVYVHYQAALRDELMRCGARSRGRGRHTNTRRTSRRALRRGQQLSH
ncbi:MAG: hypothetical protein ACK54C_06050 [Betaproteobacteria bacterium]